METLLAFLAAVILVVYILRSDASWISLRIEMFAAMFGVCYRPSKRLSFVIAAAMFYLVYNVIIKR